MSTTQSQPALQRLLALTDLSAPSRHALARAAMLAAQLPAALDLLHVMTQKDDDMLRKLLGVDFDDLLEKARQQSREKLTRFADTIIGTQAVTPQLHVGLDTVPREVAHTIDITGSELVVLGASGAGFMRKMLLGSTAERLLNHLHLPMLVVRQRPREAYRNVVVTVDFSPYSAQSIRFARRIAPTARLTLLHVYDVPFETTLHFAGVEAGKITQYRDSLLQEARRKMQVVIDAAGIEASDCHQLLLAGDARQHIGEQEQELDADLIVVGRCGSDVLNLLLPGGVTRHVLNHAGCDVLVIPPPKQA